MKNNNPDNHHEDCDFRNSTYAKESAEIMQVDIEENSEVYPCTCDVESVSEEREYTVTWTMELDASSPREAAELALQELRDPYSSAVCFVIDGQTINLLEEV